MAIFLNDNLSRTCFKDDVIFMNILGDNLKYRLNQHVFVKKRHPESGMWSFAYYASKILLLWPFLLTSSAFNSFSLIIFADVSKALSTSPTIICNNLFQCFDSDIFRCVKSNIFYCVSVVRPQAVVWHILSLRV